MNKILVLIILLVVFSQHGIADAHEKPVAGISKSLEAVSENYSDIRREIPLEPIYQIYTYYVCQKYNVDYDLVLAIIDCESAGNVRVLNHNKNGTNDSGLMQINSLNHEWLSRVLGVTDFCNPFQNIQCGVYMIADLMDRHSDLHKILMCYNMGEKRTKQLNRRGIYSSKYSRKILDKYKELKEGKT